MTAHATRHSNKIKTSLGSKIFDVCNIVILGLIALSTIYPFWDSLVV